MAPDTALPPKDEVARRKAEVKNTLRCPYCDVALTRWDVPQHLYSDWPTEVLYVCFNDECPYHATSRGALAAHGVGGGSYRMVYDPSRDWCGPVVSHLPPNTRR